MTINTYAKMLLGAVLVTGSLVQAQAQDKKTDPSGTYIWTQAARGGGPDRTNTLVLKLTGDKLTGSLTAPGRGGAAATPTDIADGKVAGAVVSFDVIRDYNGNSRTNKYSGTLADGTIKGTVTMNRNGQDTSTDWEAKLQK